MNYHENEIWEFAKEVHSEILSYSFGKGLQENYEIQIVLKEAKLS